MNEDLYLKQIEEQQFVTPKDKLGYVEEYIIIKCDGAKNILLKYSLSNSLDDIKTAIFNRTGVNLKLEKAKWRMNPRLSASVKHLMNKHQVLYSMTTFCEGSVKVIIINMRVGDKWFYTSYDEQKSN